KASVNFVWNSSVNDWNLDKVFLSSLDCFFDRFWHLLCFTLTKSYATISISYYYSSRETETSTTFNYFRTTVNRYYAFLKFLFFISTITIHFLRSLPSIRILVRFHVQRLLMQQHVRGIDIHRGRILLFQHLHLLHVQQLIYQLRQLHVKLVN